MADTTETVRAFYRRFPYPSYNAPITRPHNAWYRRLCAEPGRYLEAGCGTGHVFVGIARELPQNQYWAIDFSDQSMEIARRVAKDNDVTVEFRQHNLMEPLPFDFKFDYINCIGVIHHVESPERGLHNLADRLADDGTLILHAYGEEYHRRRFQIVEMLDLMGRGEQSNEDRFALFESYCAHRKNLERGSLLRRLYRLSLRDLGLPAIRALQRRRRGASEEVHTWYDELETPSLTNRWLDQFANPNDRAYNVAEMCDLLESAGLEPVEMLSVGRFRPEHLPPNWKDRFEGLAKRDQFRVMELLNPAPTSPTVVARKAR